MKAEQIIPAVVKGVILLIAAWALYFIWSERPATARVEIPPPPANVLVDVTTIQRATLHGYVSAYGTVVPGPAMNDQPAGGASISAPYSAVVESVLCAEGQLVKKGQVLFLLDARSVDPQRKLLEITARSMGR